MELRKDTKKVNLLSPATKFRSEYKLVEYRQDPLTGSQSRLSLDRVKRVRQTEQLGLDLRRIVEGSRGACFFCPENIDSDTPMFPPDLCPAGRIRRGECVVFPNLFPFAEFHAVGTLTEHHFLDIDEFTPEMLAYNLEAAREYIGLIGRLAPEARYPMWVWNHLPPSGASIVHPHVQILVEREPAPEVSVILERGERYFLSRGANFWLDLIELERNLEQRYIGENDSLAVLASYAPRGNREVQLVFKDVGNLADINPKQAMDFATAVVKVLRCMKEMGVNSFNVITYSAAAGENPEYHRLSARIVSRPVFHQAFYTGDCGFMERFFDVWVIESMPEDVARLMRAGF